MAHGAVPIRDHWRWSYEGRARVLRVNDALEKLAAEDAEKAELVKLRYFGGLTLEEAAKALDIAEPTARRWWAYARAWLLKEMSAPRS